MRITLKLSPEELSKELLEKINLLFKSEKELTLVVDDEADETEYLLSNPTNKKYLLDAIENLSVDNKSSFTVSEFNELYHKLSKESI